MRPPKRRFTNSRSLRGTPVRWQADGREYVGTLAVPLQRGGGRVNQWRQAMDAPVPHTSGVGRHVWAGPRTFIVDEERVGAFMTETVLKYTDILEDA